MECGNLKCDLVPFRKDKKRRDSSEDSERKKEKTKSKGKREKRSHSKEDLSSPDKGPNVSTASNVSAEGKKASRIARRQKEREMFFVNNSEYR